MHHYNWDKAKPMHHKKKQQGKQRSIPGPVKISAHKEYHDYDPGLQDIAGQVFHRVNQKEAQTEREQHVHPAKGQTPLTRQPEEQAEGKFRNQGKEK